MEGKDSRRRRSRRYLITMVSPVSSVRRVSAAVPPGKVVTFISDVHLGFGDRTLDLKREEQLLSVLSQCRHTTSHLFLVGDIFDYWFDYHTVVPRRFVRTLAALHEIRESGIPITYLMGNHDFGHFRYFTEELGIEVDSGDVEADINGARVYVSHGDGKAYRDGGYLLLRALLRNPIAQWLYRWIHPDLGLPLASRTSHGSRAFTDDKAYGKDGLHDFGCALIDQGYDLVIMGHRHHAQVVEHGNGLYVNLGHWLGSTPTYGTYSPEQGFTLVKV